jgi:DNA-binding response OmpR family regulator
MKHSAWRFWETVRADARGDDKALLDDVIEAGDFRLDVGRRKASLRERELQLTTAEFDLLVFLVTHPKKLVTPHTVLATNWGQGVRQTDFYRVLLSLRKKLESEGSSQHYLQTEPWIFYCFDPSAR